MLSSIKSNISAYSNIVNAVIGSGILSLSFFLHSSGLVLGLILSVLTYIASLYTFQLLVFMAEYTQSFTNKELCTNVLPGKSGYIIHIIQNGSIFLTSFGVCTVYIHILSYSLSSQIKYWTDNSFITNPYMIGLLLMLIIFPLCCTRKIDFLSWTSSLAIISILFIAIVVIVKMFTTKIMWSSIKLFRFDNILQILYNLPILFFSYLDQFVIISIYRELKDRNIPKMATITTLSITTCLILYTIVSVCGYILFADLEVMKGNLLDNFLPGDKLVLTSKILIYIVITFSYPILMYVAKDALLDILGYSTTQINEQPINDDAIYSDRQENREMDIYKFIGLTFVLCTITYIIGITVPNIGLLINLMTSIPNILCCLVVPLFLGIIYFKSILSKIFHSILMVILCVVGLICFSSAIIDIIITFRK